MAAVRMLASCGLGGQPWPVTQSEELLAAPVPQAKELGRPHVYPPPPEGLVGAVDDQPLAVTPFLLLWAPDAAVGATRSGPH